MADLIERIDQACKLVSILSICVNPFLYGFLNTNFRHEFTDIFHNLVRCCPHGEQCSSNSYVAMTYVLFIYCLLPSFYVSYLLF